VFLEIPFISSSFYAELIDRELSRIETANGIQGLTDFKYYCMNIDDLELFDSAENKLDLEEVLKAIKTNINEGFRSIMAKNGIIGLHNKYLQKRYKDFFTEVGVVKQQAEIKDGGV